MTQKRKEKAMKVDICNSTEVPTKDLQEWSIRKTGDRSICPLVPISGIRVASRDTNSSTLRTD